MAEWTKSPHHEGWYFWRRRKTMSDPWGWGAYFLEGDETGVGFSYWANGTEVGQPIGGWYWGPIPTPEQ